MITPDNETHQTVRDCDYNLGHAADHRQRLSPMQRLVQQLQQDQTQQLVVKAVKVNSLAGHMLHSPFGLKDQQHVNQSLLRSSDAASMYLHLQERIHLCRGHSRRRRRRLHSLLGCWLAVSAGRVTPSKPATVQGCVSCSG